MSDYDHSDPNYDPNLDPSYIQPMRSRDVGNYGQGPSVLDQSGVRSRQSTLTMANLVDRLIAANEYLTRIESRIANINYMISGSGGVGEVVNPDKRDHPLGILHTAHDELNHFDKTMEEIEVKLGVLHGLIGN